MEKSKEIKVEKLRIILKLQNDCEKIFIRNFEGELDINYINACDYLRHSYAETQKFYEKQNGNNKNRD